MSYATPAQILQRYDARVLGDMTGDVGQRVSPANLLTDPNLQACLDDASGEIDSAALVGGRYAVTDLAALTGVDQALLVRICCDFAYVMLAQRRGIDTTKFPQYEHVMDMLHKMRTGETIFNVPAVIAAGSQPAANYPCQVYPTAQLVSNTAYQFFPSGDNGCGWWWRGGC